MLSFIKDSIYNYISGDDMTICSNLIENAILEFHDTSIETPIKIFEDGDDSHFGILNISIKDTIPINKNHKHLFFTIDSSGSMNELCSDGQQKITHIKHTLENMLRVLYENKECKISLHIQTFSNTTTPILCDMNNIHDVSLENILESFQKILCKGSTNIEDALKTASNEITKYQKKNPTHDIFHIFLTDGEITSGTKNKAELQDLLTKISTNIFIGYGLKHDAQMLSDLAIKRVDEYRFIDVLENSGLVCGEILQGIIYKAIEEVNIICVGCEIFDYRINKWVKTLPIGNLCCDQKKTYHVKTNNNDCYLSIQGFNVINCEKNPNKMDRYETRMMSIRNQNEENLNTYIFRQRTLELLYEARELSSNYKRKPFGCFFDEETEEREKIKIETQKMKDTLSTFHKCLMNYMDKNKLTEDPILTMLCDDIYITYRTFNTPLGTMYSSSRQESNGRQHNYVCLSAPCPKLNSLVRQTNCSSINSNSLSYSLTESESSLKQVDDIDTYVPSQITLSPFSNVSTVKMMREVSGKADI